MIEPNGNLADYAGDFAWNEVVADLGNATLDITMNAEDAKFSVSGTGVDSVTVHNLTVLSGTFESCDGGGKTARIQGNISIGPNGNFKGGQGMLKLSGTNGQQTLNAGNAANPGASNVEINDLVLENPDGLKVLGHAKLKQGGVMKFTSGTSIELDENPLDDGSGSSSITLSSGSEGTAIIGPCAASNFSQGTDQEFTFERYIPADPNASSWVNIGAYVTGTTVADWTSSNPTMLLFKYVESNYGSLGAGWSFMWDPTAVLEPGTGYMAMLAQNESALIQVTGKFQIGDVAIPLTFTDDLNQSNETVDGWNLVSNPYPAPVDLVEVLSRVDGVEAYYVYDNSSAGSYTTRNDQGVGDASEVLAVGQSFWVKVSSDQTLTFTEADKITSNTASFMRTRDAGFGGSLGLEITNAASQWGRTFVQFVEGATAAFDAEEDAVFYNNPSTSELRVWTVAESGEKLSIQSMGSLAETPAIPLHVTTGEGGLVSFSGYAMEDAPANVCAVIEDTETGERAQLGFEALEVDLPANMQIDDRFVVSFTAMPSITLETTACDGLEIELMGEAWETWGMTWTANDGSAEGSGLPYELADGEYTFEFALPSAGCVQTLSVVVETTCLGDFNANGERDIVDLLVILAGLPGQGSASAFSEEADCDCDGVVTINDMLTFLTVFATDCPE